MTFGLANGVYQVSSLRAVGRFVKRAATGSQMPFGLLNGIAVANVDDCSPEQSVFTGLRRVHNTAPLWLYLGIWRRLEWRTTLGCEDHVRVR
jgi:hypothetical protein